MVRRRDYFTLVAAMLMCLALRPAYGQGMMPSNGPGLLHPGAKPAEGSTGSRPDSDGRGGEPAASGPIDAGSGKAVSLAASGQSKALDLSVRQLTQVNKQGKVPAAPGRSLLVLQTQWTNRLTMPYVIDGVAANLYVVVNRKRLGVLHPKAASVEGHMPARIKLEAGESSTGLVVFDVADEPVRKAELRFFDIQYGSISIPLLSPKEEAGERPLAGPAENAAVRVAAFGLRKEASFGGRKAPVGKTFVVVDLLGESVAKDLAANPALTDFREWRKYTAIVVDGQYACEPEPGAWLAPNDIMRFLPGAMTGGEVPFLVPADARSMDLRLDFPSLEAKAKPRKSAAIILPLAAAPPPRPSMEGAITLVEDEMFHVAIFDRKIVSDVCGQQARKGSVLLRVGVTVANDGESSEWFQAARQLQYLAAGRKRLSMDALSSRCLHPCAQNVWVPAGQQRSFQMIFQIPASESEANLEFTGARGLRTLNLGIVAQDLAPLPPGRGLAPAPTSLRSPASTPSTSATPAGNGRGSGA